MTPEPEFRVSLYSGVLYRRDAVSNSLQAKIDLIDAMRTSGQAIDYRVFTHATDSANARVCTVNSAAAIVLDPWFQNSQLHILEFGICYPAFDVMMVPTPGRKLVVYHNITPLRLAASDEARRAIEKSFHQLNNISQADYIVCDSDFNRGDLNQLGFDDKTMGVLPLFPSIDIRKPQRQIRSVPATRPIQLLFVGRIVESKGILDLIAALSVLKAEGELAIRLDIVGAARFSDDRFRSAVRQALNTNGLTEMVRIVGELSESELAASYELADIFVMPSYHEGFCVPLLEAMGSGCFPIVSDAGNLPQLLDGLGRVVKMGDHRSLARALRETIQAFRKARLEQVQAELVTDRGTMVEADWRTALGNHSAAHSLPSFNRAMMTLLQEEMRIWTARRPQARDLNG